MYKVTNKTNDPRRFRDQRQGKDIIVESKGYVLTNYPPISNDVWRVTLLEERKKKPKKIHIEKTEETEELNNMEEKSWQQQQ